MYFLALIAIAVACYYAAVAWRQPRPVVIAAALLWLLYAIFEVLIAQAVICGEKCNIRVDLLLIWPILWVASFFASKTPGQWSPLSKMIGVLSVGSLFAAVGLAVLVYLEDIGVFFPERKACMTGGEGATTACTQAIGKTPDNYTLYYYRALAHRAEGNYDQALADMNRAIAAPSAPATYSAGYTGRGTLHLEKGDIERALGDLDTALKHNPNDGAAYFSRGAAFARKGELDRALNDFSKFIELNDRGAVSPIDRLAPAKGEQFNSRGAVHLRLGNLDLAISDYGAALKINPQLAASLYGRGLAKMRKGDKTGGEADISRATSINSSIVEEFRKMGMN